MELGVGDRGGGLGGTGELRDGEVGAEGLRNIEMAQRSEGPAAWAEVHGPAEPFPGLVRSLGWEARWGAGSLGGEQSRGFWGEERASGDWEQRRTCGDRLSRSLGS